MNAPEVGVVMAAVFLWGPLATRLEKVRLTAPIVFVAVGGLISAAPGMVKVDPHGFTVLSEATLSWVLFCDASRVRLREFRADAGFYARLLGIGLPLTIGAGWLLARFLVPGLDVWLALVVGAALAPTDAALGLVVVTNRAVPARIRRLITVESGLNDGIVTPVVVLAIAGAAHVEHESNVLGELLVGVAIGAAGGFIGGHLMRFARRRGWASPEFAGPAVLALVILVYAAAITGHGNGFVAAFVAGLTFGNAVGHGGAKDVRYVAQTADLASLLVWMLFGATVFPVLAGALDWEIGLYCVLSLTVVRMVPVALSLLGTRLDRSTVLFVGWFGPRGVASIIFALLALDGLGSRADTVVAVIALTVLVSVIAHGVSAGPLAARYGDVLSARSAQRADPLPEFL
ncbi:MAG TPA: cation:proton antiporter [Amycolatopsis sp.]|nr:cation:proton antiporter [Amycolatopsis sp.]